MENELDATRFEAHVSKGRTWVIILLALGFAALGAWFIADAEMFSESVRFVFFRDPFILRIFGWVALAIGVLGAAIAFRQLFRNGPVLEVDARGIRWARWSDKTIPWSEITDAQPRTIGSQQFMCLTLAHPEEYKGGGATGLLAGMNKNMGYGDVAVGTQGTDRSFDELLTAVSRYRSTDVR